MDSVILGVKIVNSKLGILDHQHALRHTCMIKYLLLSSGSFLFSKLFSPIIARFLHTLLRAKGAKDEISLQPFIPSPASKVRIHHDQRLEKIFSYNL